MVDQNYKADSAEADSLPDEAGHFGIYGGRFVAETLMPPLHELNDAYHKYLHDPDFMAELDADLAHYVGRPSPLYFAERLTAEAGGAQIYLKREDLNHTGAHKINNTVGQALLAKRMGKQRVIAETGAGQHGVASATVAARFGMECVVYMGEEDIHRQAINVYRMRLLGARTLTAKGDVKAVQSMASLLDDIIPTNRRYVAARGRHRSRSRSRACAPSALPQAVPV